MTTSFHGSLTVTSIIVGQHNSGPASPQEINIKERSVRAYAATNVWRTHTYVLTDEQMMYVLGYILTRLAIQIYTCTLCKNSGQK